MISKEVENQVEILEAYAKGSEQNLREYARSTPKITANQGSYHQETTDLLSVILSRKNLLDALHRVESNNGASGIDGMNVDGLRLYLCAVLK